MLFILPELWDRAAWLEGPQGHSPQDGQRVWYLWWGLLALPEVLCCFPAIFAVEYWR